MLLAEYIYNAKVVNVVDGDTIDVVLDQGLRQYRQERVRVLGVDTPERNEAGWAEATTFTQSAVLQKQVVIKTHKSDSFGRWLAEVTYEGPGGQSLDLGSQLLKAGLAVPFHR